MQPLVPEVVVVVVVVELPPEVVEPVLEALDEDVLELPPQAANSHEPFNAAPTPINFNSLRRSLATGFSLPSICFILFLKIDTEVCANLRITNPKTF